MSRVGGHQIDHQARRFAVARVQDERPLDEHRLVASMTIRDRPSSRLPKR
jgi:hypothetical protein